ncbi:GCG_CRPN prefix-to-repeats domain-containing protein [Lichenicoccus roseus]|uniref:Sulfur globule protein n=1 Tax=Lichenicoccus roseus TaxID=2683649 RepID=A0A5R9IYI6_9PROT|nr:hypothetical protein FE263_21435 [Lichenicoccus roseus]
MRSVKLIVGVVGAVLTFQSVAHASGGCGPAYHRGPYGYCRPNFRPGPVGPRIGYYYPGQGWWYRNHYWGGRYRWHGYWRYR